MKFRPLPSPPMMRGLKSSPIARTNSADECPLTEERSMGMDRHADATRMQNTRKIRELNDRLRTTGIGGKVFLTRGVAAIDSELLTQVLHAVRTFDDFKRGNDPWGEHDFGEVVVDGERFFWKIDAYDLNLECGSPDPADQRVTRRVLTIMTAEDL